MTFRNRSQSGYAVPRCFTISYRYFYFDHIFCHFLKDLPENPYCACKSETFHRYNDTFYTEGDNTNLSYNFIWEKAEKYKWKPKYSDDPKYKADFPWIINDTARNMTKIDWNRIPLSYCEPAHGHLDNLHGQCYVMYDIFLMSLILTLGTFTIAFTLKMMRNSSYFPNKVS